MINEITQPAQLSVTEQDYKKINSIFENTGVSLPISYSGEMESWQLPVSEEFLEGINAQRRRLRTRNLQIHRQSMPLNDGALNFKIFTDGVYRIGFLRKRWKRRIAYMRGGKEVSSFKDSAWIHYYMKKEPGEETKISSMDVFRLYLPFGKNEEYLAENMISKGKVLTVGTLIIAILFWMLTGLILPVLLICAVIPSLWVEVSILTHCLICTGGISIATTWFYRKCSLWTKWREDSGKVVDAIRQKEPEFCIEKLISIVSSRMQRLMFADTKEDVGDIISCDIIGFLKDHANVVNCETQNFWFTGFRVDGNCMYLDVTLRVRLERDLGGHIERSKETIMLQLNKAVQGIMSEDLYSDWSIARIETHEK